MNEPAPLHQVRRTYVRAQGQVLSFFAGCDYFRLSSHPRVLAAVAAGLKQHGLNVAASRRTTGNHQLYLDLERQIARFFKAEAALLVSTGYLSNLVVAQTLAGRFSHVLMDEKSHVSLADAAHLLNCPVLQFPHRDLPGFKAALARCGPGTRPIVLTDGLFSGDGAVAPLGDYLAALPKDGLLLVDDAHGAGTLGAQGGGTVELQGVPRTRLVQTITLSKAFGCFGGAVICSKQLRSQIMERSRMFIGHTPLPLPLASAASAALKLMTQDRSLRSRLHQNADFVKSSLRAAGIAVPELPGPVVSFPGLSPRQNTSLRRALLKARIYPSFIRYPGAPAAGFFRFVISSEHHLTQLRKLTDTLVRTLA